MCVYIYTDSYTHMNPTYAYNDVHEVHRRLSGLSSRLRINQTLDGRKFQRAEIK